MIDLIVESLDVEQHLKPSKVIEQALELAADYLGRDVEDKEVRQTAADAVIAFYQEIY